MATMHFIPAAKLAALLTAANPQKNLNVRVLSSTSLSLETDLFQPVSVIDLAEEKVVSVEGVVQPVSSPKMPRKSGRYELVAFGETIDAYSLKELLGQGLRTLESHKPGTLEKLSRIKTTTKRIVARDPSDLFAQEHQAKQYGEKLIGEWWYGTNNSAQETGAWLKRACDCAGVQWGKDLVTSL